LSVPIKTMKKTRVSFRLTSPLAIAGLPEDYGGYGIEVTAEGHQITHVVATVEHHDNPRYEDVVLLARDRITPFLALLRFVTGKGIALGKIVATPVDYAGAWVVATMTANYESLGPKGNAHPFLPPKKLVARVTAAAELAAQLAWFNAGESAEWSFERIRNYYEVLELEEESRPPYKAPDECRWLRNAVSHPRPENHSVRDYLQGTISNDFIDPNNDAHVRFVESKVSLLRTTARDVIDPQLRV
jgi:hypothetical protein